MKNFSALEMDVLNACLERRPELQFLIDTYGELSIDEYSSKLIPKRKTVSKDLKDALVKIGSRYLPAESVQVFAQSLETVNAIDTAGHGGIISEDLTLQGLMISSEGVSKNSVNSFLALSCGVVPMNNLSWPRGLYVNNERVSLFSKSVDRLAFHETPAFTKEQIEKRFKEGGIHQTALDIFSWINTIPNIFDYQFYHEQCVLINAALWNAYFKESSESPEFLQLMLEEVTAELVIKALESDAEFKEFLFNKKIIGELLEKLSDLPGTWNKELTRGSFLFWHKSGDFRAASLFPKDNLLRGKGIEVPFTPEALIAHLKRKEIVPSVLTSLLFLVKHGVRTLGGYHQCWYLPQYIIRLKKIVAENKDLSLRFLDSVETENLLHLGYGLGFYLTKEQTPKLAGLETFFNNQKNVDEAYSLMKNITVLEGIRLALKKWYNEIVPVSERTLSI